MPRSAGEAQFPLPRLSSALVRVGVLAALAGGCGNHARVPTSLLDRSPARESPVRLESAGSRGVLTKVVAASLERLVPGSPEATCIRRQANGAQPVGVIVRRIGVWSESVTFRVRSAVVGCDGTDPVAGGGRWCGGSYGRLLDRRLRDPRLDIAGCRTTGGDRAAFAWVEPGRGARYVVVAQPGYAEMYPVVRGLPVRVATASGIESDPIAASFDVSEHDAMGRLLRAYELVARPSG